MINIKNKYLLLSIIAIVLGGVFLILIKDRAVAPVVENKDDIEIFSPKEQEIVSSPLKITGVVRGNGWSGFEGQVGTVRLQDSTGKELALGILTATDDWMKLPTPFETNLFFDYPGDGAGQLVFHNENASGEPARDKTFIIPVMLVKSSSAKTKVKVYFSNIKGEANISCSAVFYAEREIPKTEAVAKAALEELLKGPTNLERQAEFFTSINPGVKIQSLTIADGIARVDFSEELQKGVAGSCKVTAIRAQIEQTLKQFSTVKSVVISINGKTDDILQP